MYLNDIFIDFKQVYTSPYCSIVLQKNLKVRGYKRIRFKKKGHLVGLFHDSISRAFSKA